MKRWKTLTAALLAAAVLLPTAQAAVHRAPHVKEHSHPEAQWAAAFTCSPWAKESVDRAKDKLLVDGETGYNLTEDATRWDVLVLSMQYLQASYQQEYLGQLVKQFQAEKDEQGNMKLLFQDKPEEEDRETDKASTIAYYLGIAQGRSPGHFEPDASVTREEAAVMLLRAYRSLDPDLPEAPESLPFQDAGEISDWARDSVATLNAWGILQGKGNGEFDPKGPFTKEQCVLTFLRLYENAPVRRDQGNVTSPFTYQQVMEVLETQIYDESFRNTLERWEGPKATMLYEGTSYGVSSPKYTGFVYQDGRCRYFDTGLCTNAGMLTSNATLTDGRFSPDGSQFSCTVTLSTPTMINNALVHQAGVYQITVDVETLAVTHQWTPAEG